MSVVDDMKGNMSDEAYIQICNALKKQHEKEDKANQYEYRIWYLYNIVDEVNKEEGEDEEGNSSTCYLLEIKTVLGGCRIPRSKYLDEMFQSYQRNGFVFIDSTVFCNNFNTRAKINFNGQEGDSNCAISTHNILINNVSTSFNDHVFIHKMEKI